MSVPNCDCRSLLFQAHPAAEPTRSTPATVSTVTPGVPIPQHPHRGKMVTPPPEVTELSPPGAFTRGGRLRTSLPIVRSPNKSLERPMGKSVRYDKTVCLQIVSEVSYINTRTAGSGSRDHWGKHFSPKCLSLIVETPCTRNSSGHFFSLRLVIQYLAIAKSKMSNARPSIDGTCINFVKSELSNHWGIPSPDGIPYGLADFFFFFSSIFRRRNGILGDQTQWRKPCIDLVF